MSTPEELKRLRKIAQDLHAAAQLADVEWRKLAVRDFYRFHLELKEHAIEVTFDFTDVRRTIPVPLPMVDEFCDALKELASLGAPVPPVEPSK